MLIVTALIGIIVQLWPSQSLAPYKELIVHSGHVDNWTFWLGSIFYNCLSSGIIYLDTIRVFADTNMLEKLPPDSVQQQDLITAIQDNDGYNWG